MELRDTDASLYQITALVLYSCSLEFCALTSGKNWLVMASALHLLQCPTRGLFDVPEVSVPFDGAEADLWFVCQKSSHGTGGLCGTCQRSSFGHQSDIQSDTDNAAVFSSILMRQAWGQWWVMMWQCELLVFFYSERRYWILKPHLKFVNVTA